MSKSPKRRVLILCTANSCRSQMAEGVLRRYGGDKFEVYSAGTKPTVVNPIAMKVMHEIGIDILGQRTKHVSELKNVPFDIVVTVCDNAKETCPAYFGPARKLHWNFPDPPSGMNVTPEMLAEFRRVRDMIHERFKKAAETDFEN